jgi:hypothetical protein
MRVHTYVCMYPLMDGWMFGRMHVCMHVCINSLMHLMYVVHKGSMQREDPHIVLVIYITLHYIPLHYIHTYIHIYITVLCTTNYTSISVGLIFMTLQ